MEINDREFMLFKDYIALHSGIDIPPEKAYLFETRLAKLMIDAGMDSFGEFYGYVVSNADPLMHQKIINAMTTNETLWFRDGTPWKVMEEILLPSFVEAIASGKKTRVRIWSAAASTGQEIYSTVMCVDDYLSRIRSSGVNLSNFEFFASDISSRVLDIAKKGRYDAISIKRGLNDYYRTKYFINNGSAWDINPTIRDVVRFGQFNLQKAYHILGMFDIIFCRYVLIYFADAIKRKITMKMHGTLADGGVLFTGNYALYDLFEGVYDANRYVNLTYYTKKAVLK